MKKTILTIGPDLSSTGGGIASVVKTYYSAYESGNYSFNYIFLRTYSNNKVSKTYNLFFYLISIMKLLFLLSFNRNISIIHIHTSSHNSFFRKSFIVILSKCFRKKVLLHLHSSRFYEFFLTDNKFLSKWINFIFLKSDTVIALCHKWKSELLIKYPNAKIEAVYNPITIEPAQHYIKRELSAGNKIIILFVGFLIPNKGVLDLLKVAEYFNRKSDRIIFQIAGKGELQEMLEEKIKLKKYSNVDFIGWADYEKKKELYKTADIFFLPSYNEGMPIAILEAMSYSLPIISTTISGIPEEVDNGVNGFLYAPGDINGYIRGINSILKDRKTYSKTSLASWEKVQNYRDDVIFKQIVTSQYLVCCLTSSLHN